MGEESSTHLEPGASRQWFPLDGLTMAFMIAESTVSARRDRIEFLEAADRDDEELRSAGLGDAVVLSPLENTHACESRHPSNSKSRSKAVFLVEGCIFSLFHSDDLVSRNRVVCETVV